MVSWVTLRLDPPVFTLVRDVTTRLFLLSELVAFDLSVWFWHWRWLQASRGAALACIRLLDLTRILGCRPGQLSLRTSSISSLDQCQCLCTCTIVYQLNEGLL